MDPIENLENEIKHLRKTLSRKEKELSNFKTSHLKKGTEFQLPKWAIERYSRQILLPEISVIGQQKICGSSVLIVGAGGLGSPAALYLAGAGVGHIGIVDYDTVDVTNIHRQILHPENSEGQTKVESAAEAIMRINSKLRVTPYNTQLCSTNALDIIKDYDVILDASDNVVTRYLLNDACCLTKRPLVSGSALKMEGQLTVYDHRQNEEISKGPCYRCLFPIPPSPETVANCTQAGVCGPVTGVIGSLQALEAIKIIIGRPQDDIMNGRMLIYDGCAATFRTVKLRSANPACNLCSQNSTIDKLIDYEIFCNAKATDKDLDLSILDPSERISAEDYASLNQTKETVLIDVRSEAEYEMCNISGSVNIPIDKFMAIDKALSSIEYVMENNSKRVIFVCRRGNDSQIAAKKFKEALTIFGSKDIPDIYDIIGGLHSWGRNVDTSFPIY